MSWQDQIRSFDEWVDPVSNLPGYWGWNPHQISLGSPFHGTSEAVDLWDMTDPSLDTTYELFKDMVASTGYHNMYYQPTSIQVDKFIGKLPSYSEYENVYDYNRRATHAKTSQWGMTYDPMHQTYDNRGWMGDGPSVSVGPSGNYSGSYGSDGYANDWTYGMNFFQKAGNVLKNAFDTFTISGTYYFGEPMENVAGCSDWRGLPADCNAPLTKDAWKYDYPGWDDDLLYKGRFCSNGPCRHNYLGDEGYRWDEYGHRYSHANQVPIGSYNSLGLSGWHPADITNLAAGDFDNYMEVPSIHGGYYGTDTEGDTISEWWHNISTKVEEGTATERDQAWFDKLTGVDDALLSHGEYRGSFGGEDFDPADYFSVKYHDLFPEYDTSAEKDILEKQSEDRVRHTQSFYKKFLENELGDDFDWTDLLQAQANVKNIEGLNQQGSLRQAYLGSLMEQMASLAQGNEELGIPGIFDQTYFGVFQTQDAFDTIAEDYMPSYWEDI